MKIEWNKVTWYSKAIALVIFILLPISAFFWGLNMGFLVGYSRSGEQYIAPSPAATAQQGSSDAYYADVAAWPADQNDAGGFTIQYPLDFQADDVITPAPTTDWRVNSEQVPGDIFFTITIPSVFEPQTNFADAKLTVGSSRNDIAVQDCLKPDQPVNNGPIQAPISINGIQFSVFKSSDAGAGNYYETTSYRTLHAGQCYAVEYTIHSGQIENYPAQYGLQPFDEAKLDDVLDRVVGTFKFE